MNKITSSNDTATKASDTAKPVNPELELRRKFKNPSNPTLQELRDSMAEQRDSDPTAERLARFAQHSPAPWHTGGRNNSIVYSIQGYAVANAVTFHERGDEPIMRANARLVAAAPELLEACEAMLRRWHDGELTDSEHMDFIRSAIYKAI